MSQLFCESSLIHHLAIYIYQPLYFNTSFGNLYLPATFFNTSFGDLYLPATLSLVKNFKAVVLPSLISVQNTLEM